MQLAECVQIGLPMLILLVITQQVLYLIISNLLEFYPPQQTRIHPFVFLFMQYLKRIHPTTQHVLERFALLICIAVVWCIQYFQKPDSTKLSHRSLVPYDFRSLVCTESSRFEYLTVYLSSYALYGIL